MANTQSYTVQISLQSQGARVIVRDIETVGKTATAASSSVNILGRALQALGAYLSVRKFIEFADSVTNLRNRMKLLTESAAQVRLNTQALFQISKDTRSDFDTTAQVYTRMALAAKFLGESQTELLAVTKSINQAVILSGTNAREAKNGLIQLSQAIASNRLGGDELRSVLEQLPLVADVLGTHLKKLGIAVNGTRGEVRQLGFEGKITAKIIIDAFKEAREKLENDFKNTVPTIGQSLEYLATSIIQFIDKMNQSGGVTTGLARGIKTLADNLDAVAESVFTIGVAWATVKMATWIQTLGGVSAAFGKLFGTIAAGEVAVAPVAALIGLMLAGLAIVINKKVNIWGGQDQGNFDATKEAVDAMTDLKKYTPEVQEKIKALTTTIHQSSWALTAQARSLIRDDKATEMWTKKRDDALQKLIELTRNGKNSIEQLTNEQRKLAEAWEKIKRQLNAEYAALKLTNREYKIRQDLNAITEKLIAKGASGEALRAMRQEANAMLHRNQTQREYSEVLNEARKPYQALRFEAAAWEKLMQRHPRFTDLAKRKLMELAVAGLEPVQDAAVAVNKAIIEQQLEFGNMAKNVAKAYREITDPAIEYKNTVIALNELVKAQPALQEKANRKLIEARVKVLENNQDMLSGLERGWQKFRLEIGDVASSIETTLTNAFHNAEDAMVDFFDTGEFKYEDFLKTLKRDLIRTSLRQLTSVAFSKLPIPGKEKAGIPDPTGAAALTSAATTLQAGSTTLQLAANALLAASGGAMTGGTSGGGGGFWSQVAGWIGTGASAAGNAGSTAAPSGPGYSGPGSTPIDVSGGTGNFPGFSPTLEGMTTTAPARKQASTFTFNVTTTDLDSFRRSQGQIQARAQAAQERSAMRNR